MEEKVPISVVIITKNEVENIEACLKSISWADEIIIVDDFSTDETVGLAEKYTNKIFKRKMDVEGVHRNYAYSLASNEWILSLDADERVSPKLKEEIGRVVKEGTDCVVFSIPLRNYIGNYWIRWGGWYPAYKDRFFRKGHFRYEEVGVHPRVFYDGKCGRLKEDIIHYSYKDFAEFICSLNNQTSLEAEKWILTERKMPLWKALWRSIDRFIRGFILKKGYRDGVVGLFVAYSGGLYQFLSYAKYWERLYKKRQNNENSSG